MKMTLIRIERILIKLLLLKEKGYLMETVVLQEEVWLDIQDVMKLLRISHSTFYRKLKECNWKEKEIAGRKYYLKSSIL